MTTLPGVAKPPMEVNISFRVSRDLRDAAAAKAVERQENVSDVLRKALRDYVDETGEHERFDTAVDWMLNHGVTYDLVPQFFAHVDGVITKRELQRESVTRETVARRYARREERR